ncbi:styrene-oxide isomerase StyC [Panacagrimonas sp.]|uniref:styrene-oxide isomerase StyC n=1 Tax=Panacagrimonas sp. TaxID=2480088 RepID=UPI003B52B14D
MNAKQRSMVGHGALVMLIGMVAGIGLLVSLLGGIELIPGRIIEFGFPGSPDAWVRTHIGGMLNGMLIMLVAVLIYVLPVSEKPAGQLFWMLIGTGYANTLFYWAALFAPNRALSVADNRFGESNLASIVGLVPALLFAVISLIAIFILMREAFSQRG